MIIYVYPVAEAERAKSLTDWLLTLFSLLVWIKKGTAGKVMFRFHHFNSSFRKEVHMSKRKYSKLAPYSRRIGQLIKKSIQFMYIGDPQMMHVLCFGDVTPRLKRINSSRPLASRLHIQNRR